MSNDIKNTNSPAAPNLNPNPPRQGRGAQPQRAGAVATPTFTPKRFRGIDYSFRPASYWDDTSVLHATLRNVKGENRRRLIRDFHAAGHLDQVEPGLARDILPDDERRSLGRIHPSFLGGEYLPDYRTGETEIARIVLDSTTRDVFSLRARRTPTGLLRYSVVDEYDGTFTFPRLPPRTPLDLGQLVDWIDQTLPQGEPPGTPGLGLLYTIANHREGEPADRLQDFTTAESQLYPQLAAHYARLSAEWVTQKYLEAREGESRTTIIQSLIAEGKAQDPAEADALLREIGF